MDGSTAALSKEEQGRFDVFYEFFNLDLAKGLDFDEAKARVLLTAGPRIGGLVADRIFRELGEGRAWPWPGPVSLPTHHRWYAGPGPSSYEWNGYFGRLAASKSVGKRALEDLDKSTTGTLTLMPAPLRQDYSGRGLVMGYVQSGKTMNFMGLIAKAVDSGYNLVIVLSGVTNNLRDQTQARIARDLTTADTVKWYWLTGPKQDFFAQENAANLLASRSHLIGVVKKNAVRLRRLKTWLAAANVGVRAGARVLIIDDECDQASLNTARNVNRRTAVNKALTDLIDPTFMPRVSYVGYSATPFANMLGEAQPGSLYPEDFIVSLPRNEGYFGAAELFGREPQNDEDEGVEGADIVRDISNDEVDRVRPSKTGGASSGPPVEGALRDSILWFILAHSLRMLRGEGIPVWSTMMIHTSQNIGPHSAMQKVVKDFINAISADSSSVLEAEVRNLYEREIGAAAHLEPEATTFDWPEIWAEFGSTTANLKVLVDNYRSTDRLNYATTEADEQLGVAANTPGPVIVVGGNTLSRGLTLEGLVSTYFLRTSNAYDSLLQMGRWFGYRPGYADLQRIWMANEAPHRLSYWFKELAFVEEEIREQIESYALDGLTPAEVGVRIRNLPGMTITSAAKMRHATSAQVSYSGSKIQTILFDKSKEVQQSNLSATKAFISKLSEDYGSFKELDGQPVQHAVSSKDILGFVQSFTFQEDGRRVSKEPLSNYILGRNQDGELLEWNVAIYSNSRPTAKIVNLGQDISVRAANRAQMASAVPTGRIDIKTLMSIGDVVADAPDLKAQGANPEGSLSFAVLKKLRRENPATAGRGLLGIYLIDKDSKPDNAKSAAVRANLDAYEDLVGLYFVFPDSKSQQAVDYVVPDLSAFENQEEIDEESDPDDMGDQDE